MSLYLDDVIPLRLNKTEFFLPINEEDKRKNSAIFLLTPNLESSINMMRHPLTINRNLFESYYIEKDITFVLNESRQLIRNDVMPLYESIIREMETDRLIHKKRNKKLSQPIEKVNQKRAREIKAHQEQLLNESVEEILVEDYEFPNDEYILIENYLHTKESNGKEVKMFFDEHMDSLLEADGGSKFYSASMRKLLYSERIKNQKECLLLYNKVKAEVDRIKYTYISYPLYKQKNLFIDWSYYTQAFFKNNIYKLDKGVDLFFEYLDRFISDSRLDENGYKVKTIFVPVLDWVNKDEDVLMWDYTKDLNPISMIYRMIKKKSTLLKDKWGGYTFVFFSDKAYFKLDFSDLDETKLPLFTSLINKLKSGQISDADYQNKDSTKAIVHKIVDKLADGGIEITNLTGGTSKLSPKEIKDNLDKTGVVTTDNKEDEVEEKKAQLVNIVKDTAEKSSDEKNALDNMNNDVNSEWTKQLIIDLQSEEGPNINVARKARISSLQEKFLKNKINNVPIEVLMTKNINIRDIPTDNIPIDNINEEWKQVKFTKFSESYDLSGDIYSILFDLSNKSDPVAIVDMKREDTSTSEDFVETWTINCEDVNGKRFTIKLDIPKFINNRFTKLRGNIKVMSGQLVLLPIIKTDEDTAQIVSSYNKIFVRRVSPSGGSKTTRSVSKLVKFLDKYEGKKIKITRGDNSFICSKYELPIEYKDLAGLYSKIEFPDGSYITFNMDEAKKLPMQYPKEDSNRIPVYVNKDGKIEGFTEEVANTILNMIINLGDEEINEQIRNIKPDNRLSYTVASILNTDIPVIVVMAYSEGLQTAMQKANIKFWFSEKRPEKGAAFIKFNDGYLVYNDEIHASLLMSGLANCNTEDYSIKEINKKEMWLDFLDNFGGRIKADGLDNFYDLMMDPITVEICREYHLPTDYVEVLAYASDLLTDTKYNKHTDITGNRMRTNEVVAGYVHKVIAKGYGDYKTQLKRNRKDATISIKQSAVIDAILADPTGADLSILNAALEAEAANSMSFKGLSGMNSDRSYSLDKRTYDESMLGVLASSTGFAANVGITRQATINSNVQGNRGFIVKPKEINTLNTLCVTEALTPFGSTHDDPIRTAMGFIQTEKHQMRVKKSRPNLVTTGMDEALPYMTSDIFSHKFRGFKGKVIDVTNDFIIYETLEGTKGVASEKRQMYYVDLRETVMKNSDGGFFVTVKLDPCVKKGQILNNNDILAYDKSSYSKAVGTSKDDNYISYNIGTLIKLGVLITDEAFEDSSIIGEDLSDALTSTYCVEKERALSKDTNIYNIVKKGDTIEEGDPLIVFQNAFEEKDANALLKSIADDDLEAVSDLGRIHVRSKLTGWVQDIKIYRTCEIDELSPSLKKLVTEYEKEIKKTKKLLNDNGITDTTHLLEPDYKLPPTGILKGVDNGVLIKFYLKCEDKMGIGDKLVYNSALKGVIKDVYKRGDEPYTDFRPKEPIDALLTLISVNSRMVTSIILNGALNKGLIELDRKCKEMLGITWKNLSDM